MTFKPLGFFTSHSWAHGHHRSGLHALIAPEWVKGVDYHDFAIPREHPENVEDDRELALIIRNRLSYSDVLLITAGMYATRSAWMTLEVTMALALGIPIIPIAPQGQERLPRIATSFASCDVVRWNGQSIRTAILQSLPPARREEFTRERNRRLAFAMASAALAHRPPTTPTLLTGSIWSDGALNRPAATTPPLIAPATLARILATYRKT
jgi:hypothetical protein